MKIDIAMDIDMYMCVCVSAHVVSTCCHSQGYVPYAGCLFV